MWARLIEFIILFIGVPAGYISGFLPFPIIPILLVFTFFCLILLYRDPHFERYQLWHSSVLKSQLKLMFFLFLGGALGLVAFVAIWSKDSLFLLLRESPTKWALFMLLYPTLSVYPQEIVYRTFFFHRYKNLFPSRWTMIGASAFSFGYMHIVFGNIIAVVLTLLGGLLFAQTYYNTRSTLTVSVEHALYGCFVFTVGLGPYFTGGISWLV